MHRLKRNRRYLIIGISGLVILAIFINKFAPVTLPIIVTFLLIFFFSVLALAYYLLNNVRRSILISLGLALWLALRATGLRDSIYPALLVACLISLELLYRKR